MIDGVAMKQEKSIGSILPTADKCVIIINMEMITRSQVLVYSACF